MRILVATWMLSRSTSRLVAKRLPTLARRAVGTRSEW